MRPKCLSSEWRPRNQIEIYTILYFTPVASLHWDGEGGREREGKRKEEGGEGGYD